MLAADAPRRASMISPTAGAGALPVSELRFNLPSTDMFKKRRGTRSNREDNLNSAFDKLLKLDPHHRHGCSSSDDDEDDDAAPPFDISLGKEAAAGARGARGQSSAS